MHKSYLYNSVHIEKCNQCTKQDIITFFLSQKCSSCPLDTTTMPIDFFYSMYSNLFLPNLLVLYCRSEFPSSIMSTQFRIFFQYFLHYRPTVINSHSFISLKCISSSFLKGIFTKYRILSWQLFLLNIVTDDAEFYLVLYSQKMVVKENFLIL